MSYLKAKGLSFLPVLLGLPYEGSPISTKSPREKVVPPFVCSIKVLLLLSAVALAVSTAAVFFASRSPSRTDARLALYSSCSAFFCCVNAVFSTSFSAKSCFRSCSAASRIADRSFAKASFSAACCFSKASFSSGVNCCGFTVALGAGVESDFFVTVGDFIVFFEAMAAADVLSWIVRFSIPLAVASDIESYDDGKENSMVLISAEIMVEGR
mmetsp:Transcript_13397/g.15380  ORF Transcript_13397/g.15380 Transcript_13397/m.15380 type:complete len:212 (-) Transcript_13397:522-1157(-)